MSYSVSGTLPDLVWNKGIAALCDRRIPDEFPHDRNYRTNPILAGALSSSKLPENLIPYPDVLLDGKEGEIIWLRLSWLKSFVRQVLPLLKRSFVLVTGDSDSCVPSELLPEARAVLRCENLIHWFAQNYDASLATEKMSPIPIGIDFHMLAERPIWGESSSSPQEQERTLLSIRQELPSLPSRIPQVYVDFAWQQGFGLRHYRRYHPLKGTIFHETRRRLVRKLRKNPVVACQTALLPRSDMWRRRGQYAFVLSPHGMGLDCHRTWESLALGHIVLVPSSSLDSLYTELPVVPLRSWNQITPDNLESWLSRYSEIGETVPKKLTSQYWIDEIKSTVMKKFRGTLLEATKVNPVTSLG
jgi:hypothetical protein